MLSRRVRMSDSSPLLIIPSGLAARWNLLREVIGQWYRPLDTGDGCPVEELVAVEERLAIKLPTALREWYQIAGRRKDVWSKQDFLLLPEILEIHEGYVVFLVENQGVWRCAVRVEECEHEDPPVYISDLDDETLWNRQSLSVSMFAIELLAYNIKFGANMVWWASGYLEKEAINAIEASCPKLGIGGWHWPPCIYHGHRDLLIELSDCSSGEGWVYVSARTREAADEFKQTMRLIDNLEWDSCSDEWPDGWVNLE